MLWDDPGNWGIALGDLAKPIANAYGKSGKMDSVAALELIKKGFEAEWNMATDTPKGQLLE
jgi:hypothetical protein